MTQTTHQTVRRTASISREDALKGLLARFPGFDIVSFKQEGNEFVADIVKQGFDEAALLEANPVTSEQNPDAEAGPSDTESDEGDGDVTVKVEDGDGDKEEGGSEKDMLHDILSLLREMVDGPGEGAPHDDMGPTGEPLEATPGDPGINDVPAPVRPANSMEGMQAHPTRAFAHMANKRNFFVEADSDQTLQQAVAELNRELAPTHRVARIVRQDTKIVAACTKVA